MYVYNIFIFMSVYMYRKIFQGKDISNQTAPFISASKRMLPKMEQDHAERLEMAYNRLRERKNALSTTL